MAFYRSIELPPGTMSFFDVVENNIFNGTEWVTRPEYVGPPLFVGPSIDPATGQREVLPVPLDPSYATPPVPAVTNPLTGVGLIEESLRDGIMFYDGELALETTGEISPTTVTGWSRPLSAIRSDNDCATVFATEGAYSTKLIASGFDFKLPPTAIITGLKVRVERSKF